MKQSDLVGKVQTVLGIIDPDTIGITLTHEHFLYDTQMHAVSLKEASEKGLAQQPVSLENLWWVRYNMWSSVDNARYTDENLAIKEGMRYKLAGGSTFVDLANIGICRDPRGLFRISKATGLNIIMGSGFFAAECQMKDILNLTEDEMTEIIVKDITIGVGDTGIRSGIIGEVGVMTPIDDFEKKSLRASAQAQKQTGVPINIHPSHSDNLVLENIKILKDSGADLSHTVISHCDAWGFTYDILHELLDAGCYVEFDTFGYEGYFPEYHGRHFHMPTDEQRIKVIINLINEGYIDKILVSSDHGVKHALVAYGGWGYDHILRNAVPLMKINGMDEVQINKILIDNPKRMLTFHSV